MRGAKQALGSGRARILLVDLHDSDRRDELESLLTGYGFRIRRLDPQSIIWVCPKLRGRQVGVKEMAEIRR